MKMEKATCLPGTKAIISDRPSKWNKDVGGINNGLVCFKFTQNGVKIGDGFLELPPNSEIIILSKPKKFNNGNGVQVQFSIKNSSEILSAWWVCFKSKVELI